MKKLIFALAMLILLVGCSSTTGEPSADETNDTISIEDYKQQVAELNEQISNASIPLGNMAQWELNFMKTLGRPSDDIVTRAFEWLEKKSDYTEEGVKETNAEIIALMKQISDAADTGSESQMADIFTQATSLYDNYTGLYETVTSVPVSVNAFADDISTYFPAIPTDSEALTDLLGNE